MALTPYSGTLTAAAGLNTKGVYTELVAATPYDSSRLHLTTINGSASFRQSLLDLAVGPAGAEVVTVSNLAGISDGELLYGQSVAIDVDVPAGSRLAARFQNQSGGGSMNIGVLLEDRALGALTAPVTYGANTANSRGTTVDPGATVNTKGAYVQLTPSTTARIDALILCVTTDTLLTTAIGALSTWKLDIATGALGAETVVIPDHYLVGSTLADTVRPGLVRVPVSIPSGTRLAARCECSRNTANERLLRVTVVGLQEPASGGGGAATTVAHAYVG